MSSAEPTSSKGGDATGRPQRRCLVSRETRPVDEMVRFVLDADGEVVPDVTERLPGRGFWLSADRDMIKRACEKNLFAKAGRTHVRVPEGLADRIEALLVRHCLGLIGLARRAGQVAAGFEKAREWIRSDQVGLLLAASDGAPGGRRKLEHLVRQTPVFDLLTGEELGAALGRDRVVHVAIAPGGLAKRLTREAARLSGLRKVGQCRGAVTVPEQAA